MNFSLKFMQAAPDTPKPLSGVATLPNVSVVQDADILPTCRRMPFAVRATPSAMRSAGMEE